MFVGCYQSLRYNARLPPKTLRRVVSESPPFCITRRCAFRGSCIESSKRAALRTRVRACVRDSAGEEVCGGWERGGGSTAGTLNKTRRAGTATILRHRPVRKAVLDTEGVGIRG